MVPTMLFPPTAWLTNHLTAVLVVPDTVAVNCWDWPTCRVVARGDIRIERSQSSLSVASAAGAHQVRQTNTTKRGASGGFFMVLFFATPLFEHNITKGHLRRTSPKYVLASH